MMMRSVFSNYMKALVEEKKKGINSEAGVFGDLGAFLFHWCKLGVSVAKDTRSGLLNCCICA